MPRKWTPEKVAKESKKYRIKTYFEKQSSGAYKAAVRLGILDEVCSHMKNLRETWTPEKVAKESKKYNRRIDFNAGSGSAYNAATRLGILDEVCSHMESYLSAVYMFSTEFKNNTIWKIGASITVEKALARIKKISRISKLGSPKNILMLSVEDGLVTENKLLKFGKPVEFENRFDSCTEFRELTDDELKEMYNILLDDGVFINHLSRI